MGRTQDESTGDDNSLRIAVSNEGNCRKRRMIFRDLKFKKCISAFILLQRLLQIIFFMQLLYYTVEIVYVIVPRHASKLNDIPSKIILCLFEILSCAYLLHGVLHYYVKSVVNDSGVTDEDLRRNGLIERDANSTRQDTEESTDLYCSKCENIFFKATPILEYLNINPGKKPRPYRAHHCSICGSQLTAHLKAVRYTIGYRGLSPIRLIVYCVAIGACTFGLIILQTWQIATGQTAVECLINGDLKKAYSQQGKRGLQRRVYIE